MTADRLLGAAALPQGKILVAFSGGADSTALLLSLCENIGPDRVCAFHLNHCLRGEESDRDQAFCAALCERTGVVFRCARRDVAAERQRGETIEQAARRIRYAELRAAAHELGCAAIATAHTANDAAETVLLNLARGSGGAGLGGIPAAREMDGLRLVRPMLNATRAEVEQFLSERGQDYVTDSSNLSDDYSRNVLRHHALPAMERVNDRAVEHMAAAAALAREDEEYLRGEAVWLVQCATTPDGRYDADTLAAAAPPIRRRALRLIYEAVADDSTLERVHVAALERLCASDDPSAMTSLPDGVVARREYGYLVVERRQERDLPGEIALEEGENIFGGYKIILERTAAPDLLRARPYDPGEAIYLRPDLRYVARTRREGDFIRPKGRGVTKTIKKLCVELKIPASQRELLPVIFPADGESGEAAAFPGYAPGDGFAAAPGRDALSIRAVKI